MHLHINRLRELATAYGEHEILNDAQLAAKRHMAGCDKCYGIFCMEILIQSELLNAGLISRETLSVNRFDITGKIIMQISRINKHLMDKGIVLTVQDSYAGDPCWSFQKMQYMAAARGADREEIFQSSICKLQELS